MPPVCNPIRCSLAMAMPTTSPLLIPSVRSLAVRNVMMPATTNAAELYSISAYSTTSHDLNNDLH